MTRIGHRRSGKRNGPLGHYMNGSVHITSVTKGFFLGLAVMFRCFNGLESPKYFYLIFFPLYIGFRYTEKNNRGSYYKLPL